MRCTPEHPLEAASFDCWQCDEHVTFRHANAPRKAAKPTATRPTVAKRADAEAEAVTVAEAQAKAKAARARADELRRQAEAKVHEARGNQSSGD